MVQIDDAGSGSLIGGTCIGIYFDKKNIFKYDLIPLRYYTPEYFKKKLYQEYVINIIVKLFSELSIDKDEPIEVCQGYVFDSLREYLSANNYFWKSVKIEGILQEKIENTFNEYAISLGLPESYINYTKYPFHFHKLLRWVYADHDKRKDLCKTGWRSWQKYKDLSINITQDKMNKTGYFCLKCGKKIRANSPIKILSFYSNKLNIIYLHDHC